MCVRACVSINKKVTSFVPRKQTKEQKKRRRRHRRPEWNLTVLWLCSFWSKSFKRERERERDADLFFGFFIFCKKSRTKEKRSCSTFPSHKKKRATMADVQHERGYQKQVGVNVG